MERHAVTVLALALVLPLGARTQTPATPSVIRYNSLKARLVAGDTTIDYQALRFAFVETPSYDPFSFITDTMRARMMVAFRSRDFVAARGAADSLLRASYVDIDAHMIVALTSFSLGDSARGRFHGAVVRGLVASIDQPGAGKHPDTPYRVISILEEHAFLRRRGWRLTAQALIRCSGKLCDRLEVVDPALGWRRTLYFDVSPARNFFRRRDPSIERPANDSLEPTGRPTALPRPEPRPGRPAG
jgi:hypothetical protein